MKLTNGNYWCTVVFVLFVSFILFNINKNYFILFISINVVSKWIMENKFFLFH